MNENQETKLCEIENSESNFWNWWVIILISACSIIVMVVLVLGVIFAIKRN